MRNVKGGEDFKFLNAFLKTHLKINTCSAYRRELVLTSPIPSSTLTLIMYAGPILAASGVNMVSTAVKKMPTPNTCLPPYFCASMPPGI